MSEGDVLYNRRDLIEELRYAGFDFKYAHFKQCCMKKEKDPPPIAKMWGGHPLYRVSDVVAWAERRFQKSLTKEYLSKLETEVANLESLWKDLQGKYHERIG